MADAANDALLESTSRYFSGNFTPLPLDYLQPDVKGKLMPAIKKKDRAVHWEDHTSQEVISNILASDGAPGATGILFGEEYHLFGATIAEGAFTGDPGKVLAYT